MLNKKTNFFGSIVSLLIIVFFGYSFLWFGCNVYEYQCQDVIETTQNFFFFNLIYSAISILLLFLPLHYFNRFWHFAIWGLPLTIGAIVYINLTYDSGLFGFGAGFDLLLVGACYFFFVTGAFIQLARAWWTGR